jgi:hypothetical protein
MVMHSNEYQAADGHPPHELFHHLPRRGAAQ